MSETQDYYQNNIFWKNWKKFGFFFGNLRIKLYQIFWGDLVNILDI